MEYKYTKNENYEDFANGRVLYHVGGKPTFPVRLSLEIYERCLQYSNKNLVGHGMSLRTLAYIEEMKPAEIVECKYEIGQEQCIYSFC